MLRRSFLSAAPKKALRSSAATGQSLVPSVSTDGSFVILPSVSTLTNSANNNKKNNSSSNTSDNTASLPVPWLLDNCLSRRHFTGQRSSNLYNERSNTNLKAFKSLPTIVSAAVVEGTDADAAATTNKKKSTSSPLEIEKNLEVSFSDNTKATVPIATIEAFYFNKNSGGSSGEGGRMLVPPALHSASQIHRVGYEPFIRHLQLGKAAALRDGELFKKGTDEHYAALKRLALDGIILVTGCGKSEEAVTNLAAACGSFPMPTLYGNDWHVASAPQEGSKNIAYTAAHLDLHQDLAYHESMPGIQLLHCQKFKKSVVGGNTFFVDSFAVAEAFRKKHPKDFEVFTKVPVAFIKDDFDRPLPAQYYYATPHIHLNDRGEINKVFWAPSFEAPIPVDGQRCSEYYQARATFCDLLNEMMKTSTMSLRLGEGECVIWQQVRVWHGRESFTEREPKSRIFHGSYANIDQFRCNVVAKGVLHEDPTVPTLLNFMNRSFR